MSMKWWRQNIIKSAGEMPQAWNGEPGPGHQWQSGVVMNTLTATLKEDLAMWTYGGESPLGRMLE